MVDSLSRCLMILFSPLVLAQASGSDQFPRSLRLKFISNAACASSVEYFKSCHKALRAGQFAVGSAQNSLVRAVDFERDLDALESQRPRGLSLAQLRTEVVNAHLRHFDPHAEILLNPGPKSPDYAGLGLTLEVSGKDLVIREVWPDSPAARAGLREEDVLLGFDGKLDRATEALAGPLGTRVTLRVSRGGMTLERRLTRALVSIPPVISDLHGELGYLRVTSFASPKVCREVASSLNHLGGLRRLILDLRGNPGGNLSMAICVAELFLGPRTVVRTREVMGLIPALAQVLPLEDSRWPAEELGGYVAAAQYTGPLVVLIDAFSASAAELVAGALRDHGRARLLGESSSGKGSVQAEDVVAEYPSLVFRHTIERYDLPSGRSIQGLGLRPDYVVSRRAGQGFPPRRREAELYPDGLPIEGPPWRPLPPVEVARLNSCVTSRMGTETADFQRAVAKALLECGEL